MVLDLNHPTVTYETDKDPYCLNILEYTLGSGLRSKHPCKTLCASYKGTNFLSSGHFGCFQRCFGSELDGVVEYRFEGAMREMKKHEYEGNV